MGAGTIPETRPRPLPTAPEPDPARHALALLPVIAAAAARTEATRRLAALDPLLQAGLFRLLMPRSVGGAQVAPATLLQVAETLGRADASTGWCVAQTSVCSMAAALLPAHVAAEIFADARAILAWGFGPPGRALPAPGGWRITGSWSFGSGGHHATWLGGSCLLGGADGLPVSDPSGRPVTRMMLFPQDQAAFTETWDVVGLRGTGSDTYTVDELYVPEPHGFQFGAPVQPHASAPLYNLPFDSLWAAGFASVALGVARAMLESLVALAQEKTPRGLRHTLAQSAATQSLVAETDAALQAAHAFLHQAINALYAEAMHGAVGLARRMTVRQAASHAIREARRAAEATYHAAGATAVFAANPFERRMRDMHTIGQHVHGRQQHFETVGQYMLGLTPELAFL